MVRQVSYCLTLRYFSILLMPMSLTNNTTFFRVLQQPLALGGWQTLRSMVFWDWDQPGQHRPYPARAALFWRTQWLRESWSLQHSGYGTAGTGNQSANWIHNFGIIIWKTKYFRVFSLNRDVPCKTTVRTFVRKLVLECSTVDIKLKTESFFGISIKIQSFDMQHYSVVPKLM